MIDTMKNHTQDEPGRKRDQQTIAQKEEASLPSTKKYQVKIGGMHCSFCASSISKIVKTLPGVNGVNVSVAHEEALVQYDPSKVEPWQIDNALRSLGYIVRDPNKIRSFEEEDREVRRERNRLLGSSVLTFAALGLMTLFWLGFISNPMPVWAKAVMITLAFGNVFGFGNQILKMAYQSLRRLILNQHVLMELAAWGGLAGGFIGLFIYKSFPAPDFFSISIFIVSYHLLGGYSSLKVRTKTSQSVRKLLALQPPTARVIRDGKEIVVPIEQVTKNELVRVKPGESIPVDGVVADGHSSVDESIVTGESVPVEKTRGEEVIGGSINQAGTIIVKVTKIGRESFLQQVANYIEEARALKPGVLQLLDTLLRFFVPGVITAAIVGFGIWIIYPWLAVGSPDIHRAAFAALAALVMGYPCALGMATPIAMIRGGGMAAEKGILFRSSEAFHVFKDVDTIVLDKTGTLTEGKPSVTEVQPMGDYTETDVMTLGASAENLSEHPLAKAVVNKSKERGIGLKAVSNFESITGQGIKAIYDDKVLVVGKSEFLEETERIALDEEARHKIASMEEKGQTVIAVGYDRKLVGLIAIADTIKEDAPETVDRIKKLGITPVMITGDNERTARAVARMVGIERFFARVLPNKKADRIRELQSEGHKVVMVGDGINDAPALMQADIGIAIGAGTDIAIESADIIIMGNRLGAILDAYHIGRNSYGKTKQNLAIAFAFNGVGVPTATTGLVQPDWAMAAMAASVTFVIFNSFGFRVIPMLKEQISGKIKKKEERAEEMLERGEEHAHLEKKEEAKREEATRVVELKVPSMHCEGCLANIQDAVMDLDEVSSVEGDEQSKEIMVIYHGRPEVEDKIRKKIIGAGHVVGREDETSELANQTVAEPRKCVSQKI